MSTGWNQWYVKCPFFLRDDGRKEIVCEGVGGGSTLKLCFQRKQDFLIQMETFCKEHYRNCEVFRAVMEKYQED